MVRVIYLLQIGDFRERQRLIQNLMDGERWRVKTSKGSWKLVTDRDMVEVAQQLQGWTRSVYKFGCAFVHLSDFHNHFAANPFEKLPDAEKEDILSHMRYYHGGPCHGNPDMAELASYVPECF